jgi:hypothetical protein
VSLKPGLSLSLLPPACAVRLGIYPAQACSGTAGAPLAQCRRPARDRVAEPGARVTWRRACQVAAMAPPCRGSIAAMSGNGLKHGLGVRHGSSTSVALQYHRARDARPWSSPVPAVSQCAEPGHSLATSHRERGSQSAAPVRLPLLMGLSVMKSQPRFKETDSLSLQTREPTESSRFEA